MTTPNALIEVVVCEDNRTMRDLLAALLPRYGLRVTGVPSAEALDELMAERPVHLVLLDGGLPGEDGFSAAARLRLQHPHLGIVMLTARSEDEDCTQALRQSADAYFVKPFDTGELAAALLEVHGRRSGEVRSG